MIASFFGLKARACGSLSVPVLERYNLLVRLSMSGSFPSPLSRCGAFHSALSTLYRNAERQDFWSFRKRISNDRFTIESINPKRTNIVVF